MIEIGTRVEDIDLGRHTVVEASAGTGKTYTIEKLVLRLLVEEEVPLDRILIVTYTEKATGELKTRLRRALDLALDKDEANAALLQRAVEQFDLACIATIHGFCQRLLQEHALEQGQDFHAEHVNDVELLKDALREVQRKDWRTTFGDRLRAVLEKARYSRETAEKWERTVLDIASGYKERAGHQLLPKEVPDWWRRLDDPDANWAGQLEAFTIRRLHEHLRAGKRQRGQQSFDDMIATVEESLDPAHNPQAAGFLHVLRQRYRYGIVDEFQDTDPLQWRIFERIFLAGGDSRLFVVGDPKQAIFKFRGADLPTYLHAVDTMKTRYGACEYPLVMNWRSEIDLLDGLNCLFEDGEWFPPAEGVRYWNVEPPDDADRQTRLEDDRSNRAAMTIVDLAASRTLKLAQKHFARFCAHEIERLLAGIGGGPVITYTLKNKRGQPLRAGDICILVAKRIEAEPIMQALDQAGIPYSFYKQSGLWQTPEASQLEVLLQTLTRPEERSSFRKALLTCFFRVKPEDLVRAPDVPMRHPARQLYQTWLGYVEKRQWSALFRSLLYDTGLLFAEGYRDYRLAVFRQLTAALENAGLGLNLDLLGLLDWLRQRRQERDGNEADLHAVEMNQSRVKIMTIHASKGLEFPIVFLAGGFTQRAASPGLMASYHDAQKRITFDLNPNDEAWERERNETLSEQRRLLYVALTRAIFKLYVPRVKIGSKARQFAGPVGTILLRALELACPEKLGGLVAEVITPPLSIQTPALQAEAPPTPAPAARLAAIQPDGPLFPAVDSQLGKRRIVIRSFSSMTRQHLAAVGEGSSFGDVHPETEDEIPAIADEDDPLRGPVFGDMVHNVLEQLDFAAARDAGPDNLCADGAPARLLIDAEIKKNGTKLLASMPAASRGRTGDSAESELATTCRRQIAQLIWQTLRTPLQAIGARLCDIPPADRLTEVEFIFPERPGPAASADQRREEGFFTGFMDLLFRTNGKYYLVDWKTNLLPSYGSDQLERSMADAEYHQQYRLYLQAVQRWLRRVHGKDFPFLERFGGVYYLYLRGMNGRDESTGVYFHRPTREDLGDQPGEPRGVSPRSLRAKETIDHG
jgi:exodeoxyribonuclease V beta subunit